MSYLLSNTCMQEGVVVTDDAADECKHPWATLCLALYRVLQSGTG